MDIFDIDDMIEKCLRYVTSQTIVFHDNRRYLKVTYSDNSCLEYDLIQLGVSWFKMSNDAFADEYRFDFTPQKYGIYEECRKLAFEDSYNKSLLNPLA